MNKVIRDYPQDREKTSLPPEWGGWLVERLFNLRRKRNLQYIKCVLKLFRLGPKVN